MTFHRIAVSALALTGIVMAGSSVAAAPTRTDLPLQAQVGPARPVTQERQDEQEPTVGLVGAAPDTLRPHSGTAAPVRATDPAYSGSAAPISDAPSARGIPEIVLAAYRNAELVLAQSQPNCGLSWTLLAGIGRIESGHASGGNVDADGTTLTPILGPALDGTLAGNEVIKDVSGGFVRAVGPMQFLPSTWSAYASDGNGDGDSDPNNVFDATVAAGRYLCSGGLDLRDPDQRLRAVLRYNNSMAYASDVLGWAAAYGGAAVPISQVDPVEPAAPETYGPAPDSASKQPEPAPAQPDPTTSDVPAEPEQVMIFVPGLPPIPCGIFCPAIIPPSAAGPAS